MSECVCVCACALAGAFVLVFACGVCVWGGGGEAWMEDHSFRKGLENLK